MHECSAPIPSRPPDGDETTDVQLSAQMIGLQNVNTSRRLNQIDRIRANGVGDHISLPQLAVTGDQSAGKSSVLEGITGIPFPRRDGMCTQFPTEIVIRHREGPISIVARINPQSSRPAIERQRLLQYDEQLDSFEELPRIIDEVSTLMGIRGFVESNDAPAFSADVLSLEVSGNTGLHLTVVDLPGLISVSENEDDMNLIGEIVDAYLRSPRTIILAVVQATIDIDVQGIIQRARRFDPSGERTVGIITKPDLINKGTESRIAALVKGVAQIKLRLGFFLLKNPSPEQLAQTLTMTERLRLELSYFETHSWKSQNMDASRLGIENLKNFLQELLANHIENELPIVRKEIQTLLLATENELHMLGPPRLTIGQIRTYLTHASMEITSLTQAGIEGYYNGRESEFFEDGSMTRRLRAQVHRANGQFAADMRNNATKRLVISDEMHDADDVEHAESNRTARTTGDAQDQILVTKAGMLNWIKEIYFNTRGRELPGTSNQSLLSELFHEQSSRWPFIAQKHVDNTFLTVQKFMQAVVSHVIKDEQTRHNIQTTIEATLSNILIAANSELKQLVADEKIPPITYNHYFTDNIQKSHEDRLKGQIQCCIDKLRVTGKGKVHVSNLTHEIQELAFSLQTHVEVDMDNQACDEALTALSAYYKVAMKMFVDNVCRQVIERHIMNRLVFAFSPLHVSELSDEAVVALGSETSRTKQRRQELLAIKKALEESDRELRF